MAGGSFTQAKFDILRAKVNAFDKASSYQTFAPFAKTISDELNTDWGSAWNVAIVYMSLNVDAVVYGYAFNGQWFWQNGVLKLTNQYLSFIVWKDYNCVTWTTLNPADPSVVQTSDATLPSAITTAIQSQNTAAVRDVSDIWVVAKDIQDKIPSASAQLLQDKLAYTVIATQTQFTGVFGWICASFYTTVDKIGNSGTSAQGYALILQMRAS